MSDGNQLPPAGETACPIRFAKGLIQQGGAGGFACRSNGHNQRSASKMNKFPKTVRRSCVTSSPVSSNGLSAAGTWLKAIASPRNSPVTIVIAGDGRRTSSAEASAFSLLWVSVLWVFRRHSSSRPVDTQVIALAAAALGSGVFSEVLVRSV